MPILQSRLLRLLEAAEQYQDRYRQIRQAVLDTVAAASTGKMSWEEAGENLYFQLKLFQSYLPVDSILVEERVLYKTTKERNAWKRRQLMVKRGQSTMSDNTQPRMRAIPPQTMDIKDAVAMGDEDDIVAELEDEELIIGQQDEPPGLPEETEAEKEAYRKWKAGLKGE